MNDEEYIFRQDVREKAITARSAKKRPRHSGCSLPQYTAKEMRELSGPTYTVNLGERISYARFKALPATLQQEYIQNIIDKYEVGPTAIADLMDANNRTMSAYLRKLGFTFKKGIRPNEDNLARLKADYNIADAPAKKVTLQTLSFCYSGPFSAAECVKQLKAFIPEGSDLQVTVSVICSTGSSE